MNSNGRRVPYGAPLPGGPHSVSVSYPTWQSVLDYEDGIPAALAALRGGYPRFRPQPAVLDYVQRAGLPRSIHALSSTRAVKALPFVSLGAALDGARYVADRYGDKASVLFLNQKSPDVCVMVDAGPRQEEAYAALVEFWQHAGLGLSTRAAVAPECRCRCCESDNDLGQRERVRRALAALYGVPASRVVLAPSGMAAFYTAWKAVVAHRPGPTVQLGLPYVDSLRIQQRFGREYRQWRIPDNPSERELFMRGLLAYEPSGVFVEYPSNPLCQVAPIADLVPPCRTLGVPLIVDDTLHGPSEMLPLFADLVVSSLTKLVAGSGDVLGGAIVLGEHAPEALVRLVREQAARLEVDAALHSEDARVIADGLASYPERVEAVNRNLSLLVDALVSHPRVKTVYAAPGRAPLFSLVLKGGEPAARQFYDALDCWKGPSFGMPRTVVALYTLLCHYRELDYAAEWGLSANLLRVGVGHEDNPWDLVRRFYAALEMVE